MAIEDDVLVIGGGIAGVTAALSAAQHDGTVRLISHKQSTLRHASGLIDILGYTPDGEGPLADPFAALEDVPHGHPYERVGADAVRDALEFFDEIAGERYAGAHAKENALVPTNGGTIKPTARYPKMTANGLASDARDTLFVGFATLPDYDAPLAAEHMAAAGVPFETRGVTLEFPGIKRDDAKVTRYAHMLDMNEDAGAGKTRKALADAVRPHLEDEERVGFPAILGEDHPNEVREALEEQLGVDVFEVPMGPPSLPGMRLEELLFEALHEAGVRVETGIPVVDYEAAADDSDTIERVIVDRKGQRVPYHASQYVLATGGLVGKGVKSDRSSVHEPIFDCHVAHPEDRYDWFDDDAFGDQPFAQFGLTVDDELKPLDSDDTPEFSNLRAAGGVINGYDFAAEKSGSGVSLATGYVAGDRAGAEGGE